jgi:hypothetical protein
LRPPEDLVAWRDRLVPEKWIPSQFNWRACAAGFSRFNHASCVSSFCVAAARSLQLRSSIALQKLATNLQRLTKFVDR